MDMSVVVTIAGMLLTNAVALGIGVYKLGWAVSEFKQVGEQQAREISELKKTSLVVVEVVTKLALQSQRQDVLDERTKRLEELIDELRHGEGYVLPLERRVFPSKG